MRNLKWVLIAVVAVPPVTLAQDEEPVDPGVKEGLSYWLDHTDDDELAKLVLKYGNANFESRFNALRPAVLDYLNRESADVSRFLKSSDAQRRKLSLAARGAFQKFSRKYCDNYGSRLEKRMGVDRAGFFKAVHFDRGGFMPVPSPNALAAELIASPLWKKALLKVVDAKADEYQAMLEQRKQRWRQGMIDYRVSALDRKLILSDSQVDRLNELFRASLANDYEGHRTRARCRSGISAEQFWGHQVPVDEKVLTKILTASQGRAVKDFGELAHFRFNGILEDESVQGAKFTGTYAQLLQGSLYLDGDYRVRGYPQIFTPSMSPKSFTVGLRVKPASLRSNSNILTLDSGRREFVLKSDRQGKLQVALDHQRTILPTRIPIETDRWSTIACSVDIEKRRLIVLVNNRPPVELQVPPELDFEVRSKVWLFTNHGVGNRFHGLVDEFLVLNRAMTADELAALPITHSFGDNPVANRKTAGPVIAKVLRTHERLWLDHAASVCTLNDDQAKDIKLALTQFNDARIQDWSATKNGTDLLDSQPYREVIATNLPENLRETYRDALQERDERIAGQEGAYAGAVLENKFLLSATQRAKLSGMTKAPVSGGKSDGIADVRRLADRLLEDGVLDEGQAILARDSVEK